MKAGVFKRVLAVLICGLLLCVTVPAQLTFGPHGMRSASAKTLRNRTRLNTGLGSGRPRLEFVGRVGGVAFDATAKPAANLKIANMTLAYSGENSDGERLLLTVNDQPVLAPIYDWQLIPIAKFVASDSFSCFTLFGDLTNAREQRKVIRQGGRVLNYHAAFTDSLMGLRLFQLDNLIINDSSWDLVKDGQRYLLGAGEPRPDFQANMTGLAAFERFKRTLPQFRSYVISDYRRNIVFSVNDNKLSITGEPSYYFWKLDPRAFTPEKLAQAKATVKQQLSVEAQKAVASGEFTSADWVVKRILAEARSYERLIANPVLLLAVRDPLLLKLFITEGDTARKALLETTDPESLVNLLVLIKALNSIQYAVEIRELSDSVSGQTPMLRAINPTVWDASVVLLRYAAFFRYFKKRDPKQWQAFMRQIRLAPKPQPYVITPTILDGDTRKRQ